MRLLLFNWKIIIIRAYNINYLYLIICQFDGYHDSFVDAEFSFRLLLIFLIYQHHNIINTDTMDLPYNYTFGLKFTNYNP